MFFRQTLFFLLFSCFVSLSLAKVSLPALFQDGMVLQQNSYVNIWGNAAAGESIEVFGDWDTVGTSTFADTKGQWLVQIPTPEAGGPFSIQIKGENELMIRDVLIGEVWIASGQSNMVWPLNKSEGGKEEAAKANYGQIRFFKVERDVSSTPRIDCKGKWEAISPEKVDTFSAVAYYFAKNLHVELGVPIGIIQTAWGGTPAEAWTPRARLESQPDFQPMMRDFDRALSRYREFPNEYKDPIHAKSPGILYNSMLSPLIPFTLKGTIWYQGESNAKDPWQYRKLFPLMVDSWRKKWGYRFSFYFVQIAPFTYNIPLSGTGIREAQYLNRKIARSGMVTTLDLGNPTNIHPRKKKEVGERLALHALAKDYGRDSLVFEGPVLKRMDRKLEELQLEFSNAEGGLVLSEGNRGFEIAGQDKVFYPAEVRVEGSSLYLKNSKVFIPHACRYAWSDTAVASLFNKEGLPASSFRTDEWPAFFSRLHITPEIDASNEQYTVEIQYQGSEAHEIHYTINGAEPSLNSPVYEKPFLVRGPVEVKARVGLEEVLGERMEKRNMIVNKASKALLLRQTEPHIRYKGRGSRTLINGIQANPSFQDSEWLGYREEEVECVVEFDQKQVFQRLGLSFLSQKDRNIFPPARIEVYYSVNAKRFKLLQEINLDGGENAEDLPEIIQQGIDLSGKKIRYLKIVLRNRSAFLPKEETRQDSWLFWDEIFIE